MKKPCKVSNISELVSTPKILLPFLAAGNSINAAKIAKELQKMLNFSTGLPKAYITHGKRFKSKLLLKIEISVCGAPVYVRNPYTW
jgi:hypothetical protein